MLCLSHQQQMSLQHLLLILPLLTLVTLTKCKIINLLEVEKVIVVVGLAVAEVTDSPILISNAKFSPNLVILPYSAGTGLTTSSNLLVQTMCNLNGRVLMPITLKHHLKSLLMCGSGLLLCLLILLPLHNLQTPLWQMPPHLHLAPGFLILAPHTMSLVMQIIYNI